MGMVDILAYTFSCFLCVSLEFVVFILIDAVAKTPLKDARSSKEKRAIWLYEGLVLLIICGVFYLIHHTPYILLLLSVVTLGYTQIHGRVDFRYWVNQVSTKWDEFQQHEESMEEMRERSRLYGNHPPGYMPPVYVPNMTTQAVPARPAYQRGSILPKFDQNYPVMVDSLQLKSMPPNVNVTPDGFERKNNVPSGGHFSNHVQKRDGMPNNVTIHNTEQSGVRGVQIQGSKPGASRLLKLKPVTSLRTAVPASIGNTAYVFKSKVMSAFGYNSSKLPPGIRNTTNTCFANSVLQCLSRSDDLDEKLIMAVTGLKCPTQSLAALVTSCTELVYNLNMPPGSVTGQGALNSDAFCDAAAETKCELFLSNGQLQQDAAEFLMWLLETLHTALNKGHIEKKKTFSSKSLETLRFIYGDLNEKRIEDLKQACRREIDLSNGLQNNTYAEPIQRLSDLEWLTYKQSNSSIIDDLFTGQLVESQHCIECNRVSVSIQTFNILPVPIVSGTDPHGNVPLENCLAKFGIIENLYGTEGLSCPNCNKSYPGGERVLSSTPAGLHQKLLQREALTPQMQSSPILGKQNRPGFRMSDSALSPTTQPSLLMSPIQRMSDIPSDSGFHDPNYKTSTPINQGKGPISEKRCNPRLTDGQRRSLLRQLPQCLVIQLMRFRFNPFNGLPKKVHTSVSIPSQKLNLKGLIYDNVTEREDLTAGECCYEYDLYGICLHLGAESTSSGHYVAYCKSVDGQWYRFDDDQVNEIDMNYEINTSQVRENAYLLFYRQLKQDGTSHKS